MPGFYYGNQAWQAVLLLAGSGSKDTVEVHKVRSTESTGKIPTGCRVEGQVVALRHVVVGREISLMFCGLKEMRVPQY